MDEGVNLLNIILMVIAVGVFLKLRSVLGRRTGNERPPYDPYSGAESSGDNDKVVSLPQRKTARPADQDFDDNSDVDPYPKRFPYVVEDTPDKRVEKAPASLKQVMTEIAIADREFDVDGFLSGARMAYEMIVTAFADGDRKQLQPLLSPDVYTSFEGAISEREAQGHKIEQSFIGINKAELIDAKLTGNMARLTIKFISELTSSTRTEDGVVVQGDPVTVRSVTDYWTFERDIKSNDPNWRLVATGSDN